MHQRDPLCDIQKLFEPKDDAKRIKHTFEFELITPMIGGDAESWHLNFKAPIRAQSIKGQLRFWWRTMKYETDYEKLLIEENALWGGKTIDDKKNKIRKRSDVLISVQDFTYSDKDDKDDKNHKGNKIPKYVCFPIASEIEEFDNKCISNNICYIKNMTFKLSVSYPKAKEDDVINTLKLWTLFGGVGARTRRGTGSLYCKDLLENFSDINMIFKFLNNFKKKNTTEYPSLFHSFFAGSEKSGDPISVWHNLIEGYRRYRQERKPSKSKDSPPGRSYWPEPDAIRKIIKQCTKHNPEHPDGIWFPRAAFGLPIITKFAKDQGDPEGDIHLIPIGSGERFPSPVLLKVIKLSSEKVVPVCLVLSQKFPDKIMLRWDKDSKPLTGNELPTYTKDKIMNTQDPLNG
ncbi:MAG TPA: type III-B CRISPR module RAMP protein Cmr1, partial [Chitinispirillaceae bacterium]|nr:type III-B CRISPR module RAMP protein Cmr1 [Chitinispirillaceae bacterium]